MFFLSENNGDQEQICCLPTSSCKENSPLQEKEGFHQRHHSQALWYFKDNLWESLLIAHQASQAPVVITCSDRCLSELFCTTTGKSGVGLDYFDPISFTATDITFNWSRQVGTAILLMLSEDVLMSTLQSMSASRGRETKGLKNGSVRPGSTWLHQTLEPVTSTMYMLLHFWPWEVYNFSATTWFHIIFTLQ